MTQLSHARSGRRFTRGAALVVAAGLVASFPTAAHAIDRINVNYQLIEFQNPDTDPLNSDSDDLGYDAVVGDTVDYLDVFPGVDARIEVVSITNLEGEVDKIDEGQDTTELDFDDAPIWVEIDPPGEEGEPAEGGPGYAKLNIEFFESGGTFSTPVSLKKVGISVQDIDSEQYVAFRNISSYSLSSDPESVLTVTENGVTTTFAETNAISATAADEEHWVAVRFTETSSITFTVGSLQATDAEFRLSFTLPEWSVEPDESTPSEDEPEEASLASTGASDSPLTLGTLGFALLLTGGAALAIVRRSRA